MDSQRNLLVIALLFVSYLLFQQWQHDQAYSSHQPAIPPAADTTVSSQKRDIPTGDLPNNTLLSEKSNIPLLDDHNSDRLITVNSDVLSLTIDTYGGDIVQAKLLAYPAALNQPAPLLLLRPDRDFLYQAQSGLVGPDGPDHVVPGRPRYQTAQKHYQLAEQQTTLNVPLIYRNQQGIEFRKTFVLRAGDYAIGVEYQVDNRSIQPIEVQLFGQLKQQIELPKAATKRHFALQTYRGAAYSTADTRYQKYDFSAIKKADLAKTTQGGWVAMLQHYFLTAWIPEVNQHAHFYSGTLEKQQQALIGFQGELIRIQPGTQQQLRAKLWVGPALQEKMAAVAKHLDLTVDYGWLWFISQPLFKLLKFLHRFIGNWGLAIIGVTFIVRGIMYPLTRVQYTSMAKMHRLQPKLLAIRERCGDDRQRLGQEMMALYKREKVNPAGGCLPVLIQMPIFLALYWMLMGSVELRHAPFFGWIRDLSAPDPYYLLPLLMGGTMFMIQKMSPAMVTDPVQQKVMNIMPLIFTVLFLWFPSGLVLYYTVSNFVTILQQKMIFRHLEKEGLRQRQ